MPFPFLAGATARSPLPRARRGSDARAVRRKNVVVSMAEFSS
jgi:hypothetical protein